MASSPISLKILCGDCVQEYEPEYMTLAWAPGFEPGEENVLVCPTWIQMLYTNPRFILTARKMPCDDCGVNVSVAPTSEWLLEQAGRA